MGRLVYLDNAATTKTSQQVVKAMLPYFSENYGNPSSIYTIGSEAKTAVETAREEIAASDRSAAGGNLFYGRRFGGG